MSNRYLTSRLASHSRDRAEELIAHADSAGNALDRIARSHWSDLWKGIETGPLSYQHNQRHAKAVIEAMQRELWQGLRVRVLRMWQWSRKRSAISLSRALPRAYRLAVAERKSANLQTQISESDSSIRCKFAPLGTGAVVDLLEDDEWDWFAELILPSVSHDAAMRFLNAILPAGAWLPTVGETGKTPESLASFIAGQIALGVPTREVGTMLRPMFDGSRVRATRAARTFGAYVGTRANLETSEALGDLVIGYQVHSAGGPTKREDHWKRNGTKYYRNPTGEQYGMDVMPMPPVDRGGPFEDDPPGIRFN